MERHKDAQKLGDSDTMGDNANVDDVADSGAVRRRLPAQRLDARKDELTHCFCDSGIDLFELFAFREAKVARIVPD